MRLILLSLLLTAFPVVAQSAESFAYNGVPCPQRTGISSTVILDETVNIQSGDIIYAVERRTGRCAGAVRKEDIGAGLTVWGDDRFTSATEGVGLYEPFDLEVQRNGEPVRRIVTGWTMDEDALYFASYIDPLNTLADSLDEALAEQTRLLGQLEEQVNAQEALHAEEVSRLEALLAQAERALAPALERAETAEAALAVQTAALTEERARRVTAESKLSEIYRLVQTNNSAISRMIRRIVQNPTAP